MYKCVVSAFPFLVLLGLFSFGVPAIAQAQAPDQLEEKNPPSPVETPSKRHFKVADKGFWTLAAVQIGATMADFETTQWAERSAPYGAERNPLFGRHPDRPTMYIIGFSLTSTQIFLQYRSKAFTERKRKLKHAWMVGALANTGLHTFLAVHNAEIASR